MESSCAPLELPRETEPQGGIVLDRQDAHA